MDLKISGIYKIQSIIKPERIYIGSSVNIKFRWRGHINALKTCTHGNSKLQRHYNKYGESDLQFSVLLGCDKENLISTEQFFLDIYYTWFNIYKTAMGPSGFRHSVETIRKNSEAHKGQIPWNKGKKNCYSEESIIKMKENHKGPRPWRKGVPIPALKETWKIRKLTPVSEITKQKLRDAWKNDKSRRGRKNSEETKQRMRVPHKYSKRRPMSEETKNKIGNANSHTKN